MSEKSMETPIRLIDLMDDDDRAFVKANPSIPVSPDSKIVRYGRTGKGFVAEAKTTYSPELRAAVKKLHTA